MDPYDRFFRRSLRDILVSEEILTQDEADELVESAYESNEPFGVVVVDAGYMTAWDLLKVVSANYQIPVLPLADYELEARLLEEVTASTLYQYQLVPVGKFGKSWTFAILEPPSRECIESLRELCGPSLFFFAADANELKRVLADNVKVVDVASDDSWKNIFDSGDQAVQKATPEEAGEAGEAPTDAKAEAPAQS